MITFFLFHLTLFTLALFAPFANIFNILITLIYKKSQRKPRCVDVHLLPLYVVTTLSLYFKIIKILQGSIFYYFFCSKQIN
jgi:hypothetical protein